MGHARGELRLALPDTFANWGRTTKLASKGSSSIRDVYFCKLALQTGIVA